MPYDNRFINAKNIKNKLLRDKKTGNLVEYCMHQYVIYPVFGTGTEYHSEFIPLNKQTFEGFRGMCQYCGDIIYINAEDVLKDDEQLELAIDKLLKVKGEKRWIEK